MNTSYHTFSSIELGEFRIGFKIKAGIWEDVWLDSEENEMKPPITREDIFQRVSSGRASIILEIKNSFQEDKIFVYFGDIWKEFDQDYSVTLLKDSYVSQDWSGRWISDGINEDDEFPDPDQDPDPDEEFTFSRFKGLFWGVAHLQMSLRLDYERVIYQSKEEVFLRRLKVGFDPWRQSIYHDIFNSLETFGEKVDVTAPTHEFGSSSSINQQTKGSEALKIYFRIEAFLREYLKTIISITFQPTSKTVESPKVFNLDGKDIYAFSFRERVLHFHHIEEVLLIQTALSQNHL